MKFSVNTEYFLRKLNLLRLVVNSSHPYYRMVNILLKQDSRHLQGGRRELGLRLILDEDEIVVDEFGDEFGTVLVDFNELYRVIAGLKESKVIHLECNASTQGKHDFPDLVITYAKTKGQIKIKTEDLEQMPYFPDSPQVGQEGTRLQAASVIWEGITLLAPFVDPRPDFQCYTVTTLYNHDKLTFWATDRVRAVQYQYPLPIEDPEAQAAFQEFSFSLTKYLPLTGKVLKSLVGRHPVTFYASPHSEYVLAESWNEDNLGYIYFLKQTEGPQILDTFFAKACSDAYRVDLFLLHLRAALDNLAPLHVDNTCLVLEPAGHDTIKLSLKSHLGEGRIELIGQGNKAIAQTLPKDYQYGLSLPYLQQAANSLGETGLTEVRLLLPQIPTNPCVLENGSSQGKLDRPVLSHLIAPMHVRR